MNKQGNQQNNRTTKPPYNKIKVLSSRQPSPISYSPETSSWVTLALLGKDFQPNLVALWFGLLGN